MKKSSTGALDIENNQSDASIIALKGRNRAATRGDLSFFQEESGPNKEADSFMENSPNRKEMNKDDKSQALEINQEVAHKSNIPAIVPARIKSDS